MISISIIYIFSTSILPYIYIYMNIEQAELFGHELGQGTPGPPRVNVRSVVCTPSPSAAVAFNLSNLSGGSLSPLPLVCKCCKPVSNETSPSGLPPAPKMRAVNV